MAAEKQSYTVLEVCEKLSVKPDSVRALIRTGKLKAVNVAKDENGKRPRWRIFAKDLEDFLQRRASGNVTPEKKRKPKSRPGTVIQFFK